MIGPMQRPASAGSELLPTGGSPASSALVPAKGSSSAREAMVEEMRLIPTTTWSSEVVIKNEVRMLARCANREHTKLVPTVFINFELAAWNICNLIEVGSYFDLSKNARPHTITDGHSRRPSHK